MSLAAQSLKAAPMRGLTAGSKLSTPILMCKACTADLAQINLIVARALNSWNLSPRVQRLALPSLLYDEVDLQHMQFLLAHADDDAVGVAAWEETAGRGAPDNSQTILLHGLYVMPEWQGRHVGSSLLIAVEHQARDLGCDGITVAAWRQAEPFFRASKFLPDGPQPSTGELYPKRMRKCLR